MRSRHDRAVTWAIDSGPGGRAADGAPATVTVDVPSGRLACTARLDADRRVAAVRFRNVPSFVLARDVTVRTPRGLLTLDIAFGGAFYGTLDVATLGMRLTPAALPELIALQRELRPALERSVRVVHPDEPELAGIYGVIFWEALGPDEQRNVTVFADGEIDRSPCGSGTSARLAVLHARGELALGDDVPPSIDRRFGVRGVGRRRGPAGRSAPDRSSPRSRVRRSGPANRSSASIRATRSGRDSCCAEGLSSADHPIPEDGSLKGFVVGTIVTAIAFYILVQLFPNWYSRVWRVRRARRRQRDLRRGQRPDRPDREDPRPALDVHDDGAHRLRHQRSTAARVAFVSKAVGYALTVGDFPPDITADTIVAALVGAVLLSLISTVIRLVVRD